MTECFENEARFVHRLPVPPRSKSKSIPAKGLFPGAEVIRGPHWKWKNDDGMTINFLMIKQSIRWIIHLNNSLFDFGGILKLKF